MSKKKGGKSFRFSTFFMNKKFPLLEIEVIINKFRNLIDSNCIYSIDIQ